MGCAYVGVHALVVALQVGYVDMLKAGDEGSCWAGHHWS
jgi:hypothetical protein